jgi:sortase A
MIALHQLFPLGPWWSGRGPFRLLAGLLCLLGVLQMALGAMVPAKAALAQMLLDRAFARSLATHHPQKPWPWADMAPVARITVPRLDITRTVLSAGSGQAMAFAPTLLPGTAAPGAAGVTVIAAHRDTHFRFLAALQSGDVVTVQGLDGATHRYRVTGHEVVRWDHFALPSEGFDNQLALSTCYPFEAMGHGPLRYVVWAAPVD